MPPIAYADLNSPQGADNMGGTKQYILFAPVADFSTIAPRPASPANIGQLAEITGNHTFGVGKGFLRMYVTLDTGKLMDEVQGERDGRSYKTTVEVFHPGMTKEILGFLRQAKNDQFIVLVPLPDGKYRQIGTEDFYAEIIGKTDTGTNSSGRRGTTFTIEAMETGPILYSGTITEI